MTSIQPYRLQLQVCGLKAGVRTVVWLALWLAVATTNLHAQETVTERPLPAETAALVSAAQWAGAARMRFFGFDIYDARLWVSPGFKARDYAKYPLVLELTYLRRLDGQAIAQRSLKEMQRSGSFRPEQEQRWLAAMAKAFPDVQDGDRLTGVHLPGEGARFYFNGQPRATIADADFSAYFFGIWLSEQTSEPRLRSSLLGRVGP